MDGNLTVTFLAVRTFLPRMMERGRGSIVTLASTAARLASGERIGASTGYATSQVPVLVAHLVQRRRRHERQLPSDDRDQDVQPAELPNRAGHEPLEILA